MAKPASLKAYLKREFGSDVLENVDKKLQESLLKSSYPVEGYKVSVLDEISEGYPKDLYQRYFVHLYLSEPGRWDFMWGIGLDSETKVWKPVIVLAETRAPYETLRDEAWAAEYYVLTEMPSEYKKRLVELYAPSDSTVEWVAGGVVALLIANVFVRPNA